MNKKCDNIPNKIVVVGMQRTGTTTLAEALYILGYKVIGTPSKSKNIVNSLLKNDENPSILKANNYDAFQDLPWLNLYKRLDKSFPGSKFILTLRDKESWISSMIEHFSGTDSKMRVWAYGAGSPSGNEGLYLKKFIKHNNEVLEYFKDRPKDLLVMNLSKGDGWEQLCDFLGTRVPKRKFPHNNKRRGNYSLIEKLKNYIINIISVERRRKIYKVFGIKDNRNKFHTMD